MLGDNFYRQVQEKRLSFLVMSIIAIVFTASITFTFVIPGLKGFEWSFLFIALLFYFVVANIFIGLFKGRPLLIFIVSLLLSALGMGWRLWLEWGEFSLVEHTNPIVLISYPFIIAIIILLIYYLSSKFNLTR
ncbi:ABC transporter permease [Oceanobacillus bengalensis]|uniref:ABC transporter permease n=1 Tax=Oceanobacillus bengalensis TaxID=1435466 RepID=A0A494YTK4_9BACI|nr:ABC transporter permease [Oceanobacillus bengalensis]RKQ13463.1 ABC transporter permease [Oceanobacillus bengalensis]